MSHLVLARKYRPRRFDEVLGQDIIVNTLKSALIKDRIAHALLLTGSRGVGKTTIARIVAKALSCQDLRDHEPCNLCSHCLSIDSFSSLDVIEIDGASNTSVDDVRDLRESARYQPTSSKYKIFIIDEVHMLSLSAFNALLKILEEPPQHVLFIFATTEAHKIPKTILSRCQRYDFKRVDIKTIHQALKNITIKEGYVFDDEALKLLSELADGSIRDALSMTEQVLSSGRTNYDGAQVSHILGVVDHHIIKNMVNALLKEEVELPLSLLKEVYDQGLDMCHLMDGLSERFRVLSLCAHLESFKKAQQLLPFLNEEDFVAAKVHDKNDLKRLFAMALEAEAQVFQAKKPLYAMEMVILKLALRPPLKDALAISFALQKLDAILQNRPLAKEQAKIISNESLLPRPAKTPIELFHELVRSLKESAPLLASHLRHARPHFDLANKRLELFFEQSLHFEQISSSKHSSLLNQAVKEIFAEPLEIKVQLTKEPSKTQLEIKTVAEDEHQAQANEKALLHEKAANHPIIKKALSIFGGEISKVSSLKTHDVI